MSGFEIVGVVLGGIPLIITALEHYKKGVSTLKTWRYYDREICSLVRDLKSEETRFQNAMEKLLEGLIPSSKIDSLVKDRTKPEWTEVALQDRVKSRLHRSYEDFEYTAKQMENAMITMMKKLGLESDGTVRWTDSSVVARKLQKAAFTLNRSEYRESMSVIRRGITSMHGMISENQPMEQHRKLRSQTRLLRLVCNMTGSVYRALRSNFQCGCTHDIRLGLEARSTDTCYEEDDEERVRKLSFRLAFSTLEDTQTIGIPQTKQIEWKGVAVYPVPKTSGRSTPSTAKPSQIPISDWRKKKVTFMATQVALGNSSKTGSTATITIQPSSESLSITSLTHRLPGGIDLCKKICRSQKQSSSYCYGKIMDNAPQDIREFQVHSAEDCQYDMCETVSLRKVLESPKDFTFLSYFDKLRLAVIISSSFLQLHQTPWLPNDLTSNDILFLKKENEVLYTQAFVLRRLPDDAQGDASNSGKLDDSSVLRSLGILLLELNLKGTLDSFRTEDEIPSKTSSRLSCDFMTVERLLQQREKWGAKYTTAVQRCIWGGFGQNLDLSSDDVRQQIYANVVAFLEAELSDATLPLFSSKYRTKAMC